MRVVADLQLHSKYAMATSKDMDLEHLAAGGTVKGLNLLGTGDFTHPKWFAELKSKLQPVEGTGLFSYSGMTWMLSGEVSTVYEQDGKVRKVHHLLYAPDFETVAQANEFLSKHANLASDGRPVLTGIDSAELVEMLTGVSKGVVVIPAHCLLPDELIVTNPGAKQIQDAKAGDSVLSHTGMPRKILRVLNRQYSGDTVGILPWYFGTGIEVTPEHPVLAIKTFKDCNGGGGICKPAPTHVRNCHHHYYRDYVPKWVPSGELSVGDVLLYPRVAQESDMMQLPVKPGDAANRVRLHVEAQFCRLTGYYLAEGYSNGRDGFGFSFGKDETSYVDEVKELVSSLFGIKAKRGKTMGDVLVYSKDLMHLFESLFYDGYSRTASHKRMPEWMLYLPKAKQAEVFRGWWRGDSGSTSSLPLCEQMKIICLRLGIIPCVRVDRVDGHKRRGRRLIGARTVEADHDNYMMEHLAFFEDDFRLLGEDEFKRFVPRTNNRHGWMDERYAYLPIRKISRRKYAGLVYNLEVEVDNSYLTGAASVHNCWTPWFGVFGSKSGFDSLRECYRDQTPKIFAIETGLSSDPSMNWRLSALDRVTLVSNSDAHSPNPWRLGREANVFELPTLSYEGVFDPIRQKDGSRFLFTIEVDPSYGKYHFTGHKKCGVSVPPEEAKRLDNKCPKCGKKMTVGVLQRVEELADRPEGYVPPGAIPFKRLLPLYEVISFSTGVNRLYAKSVLDLQDRLINRFGDELTVLLETKEEELAKFVPPKIARAILASREGRVKVVPGYDGAYGVPVFDG